MLRRSAGLTRKQAGSAMKSEIAPGDRVRSSTKGRQSFSKDPFRRGTVIRRCKAQMCFAIQWDGYKSVDPIVHALLIELDEEISK